MPGNTFGTLFRLTTFGESHGRAVGGVIDGCPAGLPVDPAFIQQALDRRRPGQSMVTSQRSEEDRIEILSGLFEGTATGAPIAFMVANTDARSSDYDHLREAYRPSHADYTYDSRYGFRDWRGGGRASARETLARVAGGAIAQLLIGREGIRIHAYVSSVGEVKLRQHYSEVNLSAIDNSPVRCPDADTAERMSALIMKLKAEGDTVGGVISCVISGVPAGLGEPVFDRLQADLAKAMLSINAAKGFEYGEGFGAAVMRGSQHNDAFAEGPGGPVITSNHSGGIQGGISTGQDIFFRVAFKPVATLMMGQDTVTRDGAYTRIEGKGRHDVCIAPRAVPVVEAMAALVIADHLLRNRTSRL